MSPIGSVALVGDITIAYLYSYVNTFFENFLNNFFAASFGRGLTSFGSFGNINKNAREGVSV